jgi:hypothetical protein
MIQKFSNQIKMGSWNSILADNVEIKQDAIIKIDKITNTI